MKTSTLRSSPVGRSLLAFTSLFLLLGLFAGQAAAATASGTVTVDNDLPATTPILTVVVTTDAASGFCFLAEQMVGGTYGNSYNIALPNKATCAGSTQPDHNVNPNDTLLVFVDTGTNDNIVAALNTFIEKPFRAMDGIVANFTLVTGVVLDGNVSADSLSNPSLSGWASNVVVFATNPDLGWAFIGQTSTNSVGDYTLFAPPGLPGPPEVLSTAELAVDASGNPKYARFVVDPSFITESIDSLGIVVACSILLCPPADFLLIDGVTLNGTVIASDTNSGLPGALVEAFFVATDPTVPWTWLDDDVTSSTAPIGTFSVRVPGDLGSILLRATAAGYLEKQVNVPLTGSATQNVENITLTKAVVITGQVLDVTSSSTGLPAVGLLVVARSSTGVTLDSTTTNSTGGYALTVAASNGTVTVRVVTTTFFVIPDPASIALSPTQDVVLQDFYVNRAVTISGTVTTSSGAAIGGASVVVTDEFPPTGFPRTFSTTTGSTGAFSVRVLAHALGVDDTIDVTSGSFFQPARVTVLVAMTDVTNVTIQLTRTVTIDTVAITKATWSNKRLTVFATSTVLGGAATLKVRVVDSTGQVVAGINGNNCCTMNYWGDSDGKSLYVLAKRVTKNLVGFHVIVTSSLGGNASATITSQ